MKFVGVGAKRTHDVPGDVHILEHALELGGELRAALGFEPRDHALLRIHARGFTQQQALGEIFFVKSLEDVFALNVPEQRHGSVQDVLELILRLALTRAPQLAVDVLSDELRRPVRPLVHERLEALLDHGRELLVAAEGFRRHVVSFFLQLQQLTHHVLVVLLILHDGDAPGAHRGPERRTQPVQTPIHAP